MEGVRQERDGAGDVWIINGIPGAGKSTVARALASALPRAVHIEGDRLQEWIISGAVGPGQPPLQEEQRQIRLNVRNQCLLACSYGQDGFVPILDYVLVSRERLAGYQAQLGGLRLHLVTLAPGVAVALERDRLRPEKTVAAAWTHLDGQMREELRGIGLWVDTSRQTVAQTVAQVLSHQELARV